MFPITMIATSEKSTRNSIAAPKKSRRLGFRSGSFAHGFGHDEPYRMVIDVKEPSGDEVTRTRQSVPRTASRAMLPSSIDSCPPVIVKPASESAESVQVATAAGSTPSTTRFADAGPLADSSDG